MSCPSLGLGLGLPFGKAQSAFAPFLLGSTYADSPGDLVTFPMPADATAAGCKPTHVSALYFPSGKAGYKWWAAFSPYKASGGNDYENPCVVASNDGTTWTVPTGGSNPIEPVPVEGSYNADPFLYWDNDGNQFVLIWKRQGLSNVDVCRGRTSADGVTWSDRFDLFEGNAAAEYAQSPSLAKHNGTWYCWTISSTPTPNEMVRRSASSLTGPWTSESCTVTPSPPLWHAEIRRYNGRWVCLINAGPDGSGIWLIWATSDDGLTWTVNGDFPFAIGWDGTAGGNLAYYKSGFILHPQGESGRIGTLIHVDGGFTRQPKITDLVVNPASQLAAGYLDAAIDAAIGTPAHATYKIGDRFLTHSDGSLNGKELPSGETWAIGATAPVVASNKVAWGGAAGYGVLDLGAADGTVGVRFSTLRVGTSYCMLEFRSDRNVGTSYNQLVLFTTNVLRLRSYVVGSPTTLAEFNIPDMGATTHDGAEWIIDYRGTAIKVYWNGRRIMSLASDHNQANTKVAFALFDATTRVDAFFAHT